MSNWFYARDNQRGGPVTREALQQMVRNGQIRTTDLVWTEGMPEWTPASRVPEISGPPPLTGAPAGPVALNYATPGLAQGVIPPQARPLPQDTGPVVSLTNQFTVRGKLWMGPAVATPKAIYLVKTKKSGNTTGMALGGVVGALIQSAMEGKHESEDVRTCAVANLGPAVRGVVDKRGKLGERDVIVLPLDAAQRVQCTGMKSQMLVNVGGDEFKLMTAPFFGIGGGGKKKKMEAMGWQFNTPLSPTAAPMHGGGFERPGGVAAKVSSPASRVLKILVAIGILVAIVLLNVLLRYNR